MASATKNVIVVGAGPAGCAAALALHRRGRRVLLLDRATFPRQKVCGDMLVPGALGELDRLGLPLADLRSKAAECEGARFVAPDGGEFGDVFARGGERTPCWTVPRFVFDAWLLEQCLAAGIAVRTGCEAKALLRDAEGRVRGVAVRVGGRDEELEAALVIAADGAGSNFAGDAGGGKLPPEHLGMAYRGYARGVRQPSPRLEIFMHPACVPGCAWIVPVGGGEHNVGLGLLGSHNPRGLTPKKLLDELRHEIPALAERLAGIEIGPGQGWILPIATAKRSPAVPGLLLAGDAAALIDPLTGHGIHNALHSGRMAGESAAEAADPADAALLYRRRLDAELRPAMRVGRELRRFSQFAAATNLLTAASRLCPPLRRWLVRLIGHAAPLPDSP